MRQRITLVIGTGRCGTASLARVLNQQRDTQVSYESPPLLPWKRADFDRPMDGLENPSHGNRQAGSPSYGNQPAGSRFYVIRERFARFRRQGKAARLGDAASFYLPYIDEIIAVEPEVRIVCLKRPKEEVVASFCEWLDQTMPLPVNHWARQPAPGWHHDPNRTRTFPQYDTQNREDGIRRYWDEYYRRAEELICRYPQNIRIFDTYQALNTEQGLREVLSFVGIPPDEQVLAVGTRVEDGGVEGVEGSSQRSVVSSQRGREQAGGTPAPQVRRARPRRPMAKRSGGDPMDHRRCVILVPFADHIVPACERALKELERRGYDVRRIGGYAAIDQGRNQMATDALLDGYQETFWIDADVEFHPNAIDQLRSHGLPIVCGVYPQKGKRAIACHVMPGAPNMVFGRDGGLVEILYAAAGFLHVRREVYLTIQDRLALRMCNERFGSPMVPFFHPMPHPIEDGHWYLAEDYAFCQRARSVGFKIMADTTVRLWHVGRYAYGWEDAGMDRSRYESFTLNFNGPPPAEPPSEPPATDAADEKQPPPDVAEQSE